MNEKQRADFEKWAKSIPFANLNRHLDGYENSSINTYWAVWQAAIASVVVELPKVYRDAYADDYTKAAADGREYAIDDFKQSLKDAGIRYE